MESWREELRITARMLERPCAVACVDAEVAGFYTLAPSGTGQDDWELDNLWVDPARMDRGIGRALVRHALAAARAAGARRVRVDSDPHAEAFYLACGAQRTGAVAAPIADEPGRTRPQLAFDFAQS